MDGYLKSLRSQMNDFEEQAADTSLEEERLRTAIQFVEKDIESVTVETKRFKDHTGEVLKLRGDLCSQILEKQKQIVSLEYELSTFTQTLEFLRREKVALLEKLLEKSAYYEKIHADFCSKLLNQQELLATWKSEKWLGEEVISVQEGISEVIGCDDATSVETSRELESRTSKLEEIREMRTQVVLEIKESNHQLELLRNKIEGFSAELRGMHLKALEEEHQALATDRSGEMEYLQSLQDRVEQLQGISSEAKCPCGMEYKVEFGNDILMLSTTEFSTERSE